MHRHRHRSRVPSPWIARFAGLIAAGGQVLDLACGGGRHTRYLRRRGLRVTAIDIDTGGLADLAEDPLVEIVEADLERPGADPLAGRRFDAVVVTDYLFRPLLVPLGRLSRAGRGLPLRDLRRRQRTLRPPAQPGLPAAARRASGACGGPAHGRGLRERRRPAAQSQDRAAPLRPAAGSARDLSWRRGRGAGGPGFLLLWGLTGRLSGMARMCGIAGVMFKHGETGLSAGRGADRHAGRVPAPGPGFDRVRAL